VDATWGDDYAAALAEAAKSKRFVLADFTGSDWCGWCIRLKAEVFETPEFKAWAAKNAVLLELDFPQMKALKPEVKRQNEKLAAANGIEGYPTIVFFNAKGEAVGKMGYERGGPAIWLKKADELLARAKP
jgi:protein disulfide-isomerase